MEALGTPAGPGQRDVMLGGPAGRGGRRGGVIVGGLAVALLAVGLAVGSGDGESGGSTGSTSAPSPTTTRGDDRSTRVSRPPRTTTTTVEPSYMLDGVPDLGGTTLYATTGTGDLLAIDPAGVIRVVATEGFGANRGLLVRAGGVVATDGNRNQFWPDGGDPVELETGAAFPAADPGQVWVQTYGPQTVARLQRVADGVVVLEVPLPPRTWGSGTDGRDLLVVAEGSGTYRIDPSGASSLVVQGTVMGATPSTLLVHQCDDALVCGYVVVDRATGAVHPSPVTIGIDEMAVLDPTGARVALIDREDGARLEVVDLASGGGAELGPVELGDSIGPVAWSTDGSRLFWLDGGDLRVWVVGGTEAIRVRLSDGTRTRPLHAIGVAP